MGRQQDLINKNTSGDKGLFQFTLNSAYIGQVVLDHNPDGYESDQFAFTRDMKYFGIFRKYTQNEMKFVKEGRDYVQACYENQGSNAEVTVNVKELNPNTQLYEQRFDGTLDFSTYKINEISADVQVIDGTFIDKIFNRQSVKVDLLGTKAIDGADIGTLTPKVATIPAMDITQRANWSIVNPIVTQSNLLYTVPLIVGVSNFSEAANPYLPGNGVDRAFFKGATEIYNDVHFKGDIASEIVLNGNPGTYVKYILRHYNSLNVSQNIYTLFETDQHAGSRFMLSGSFDVVVPSIAKGDYLIFEFFADYIVYVSQVTFVSADVQIYTELNNTPESTTKAVMYHEAFERVIAQYTGLHDKIYSDFFGRTDLGYASDGIIGALTTGMFIRQIIGVNDTMPICLKDLFEALSLYNIGMGLVNDKLRIEPMQYWFQNNIILDLSDRIAVETIAKEVIPDLLANSLKFGFNSFDYDRIGGIYEYNTTSLFTTILKLENEFSLVSPYRADMTGILKLLIQAKESTDNNSDSTVYLLDMVRDSLNYKLRTSEGFEYATGGVDTVKNFNLMLTPARTLRRWGRYIRAMLDRWPMATINWQTSANGTTLKSKLSGGGIFFEGPLEVSENANIQIQDLDTPLWHPEKYVIETFVSRSEFNTLMANPYGIIKLGPGKYGWLLNAKCKNQSRDTELQLLRVNTKYVTPVGAGLYFNTVQSQSFQKLDCSSGVGSIVEYTVSAGAYSSTLNLLDANNKALADIAVNGQHYANFYGTCSLPRLIVVNTAMAADLSLTIRLELQSDTSYIEQLSIGVGTKTIMYTAPVSTISIRASAYDTFPASADLYFNGVFQCAILKNTNSQLITSVPFDIGDITIEIK